MKRDTWTDAGQVYDNGPEYTFSLLLDYENYVKDYGAISTKDFLKGWTCICRSSFENFKINDIVYDVNGFKYKVTDQVYYDDESMPYVEATQIFADGRESDYTSTLYAGDVYSDSKVHTDYYFRRKKLQEGEESICPILITKINQPQN